MRDPSLIRIMEDEESGESVFTTNEAAYEAFMASLRSSSRKKQRRYHLKLQRFLAYLDGYPLPKVTLRQFERYIANVEDRCKHLYTGRPGPGGHWISEPGCKLKQPLDCTSCPYKQRIQKRTAGEDVTVLTKFTSFLARHQYTPINVFRDIPDAWWDETSRTRKKEYEAAAVVKTFHGADAYVRLIESASSAIEAGVAYFERRYGNRPSEIVRIQATPESLDPDLEWIRFPQSLDDTDKRINVMPYPLDNEARRVIRAILHERAAILNRTGKDTPHLFVNRRGDALGSKTTASHVLNRIIRRMATSAGINPEEISNVHGRRGFTNAAEDNGVVHHDLVLVRGGNHQYDGAGNYIDPKRLQKAFLKASPPLGVSVAHLTPIHHARDS